MLCVRSLGIRIHGNTPVRDVSFTIREGEMKAVIGESGSGKSLTALGILSLLPDGAKRTGSIIFRGKDISGYTDRQMEQIRGSGISAVFQSADSALSPVYTIGRQTERVLRMHGKSWDPLDLVGLGKHRDRYPHELSGGMQQRALIAMALAPEPSLLIADEITSSLDGRTEAGIMELLKSIQRERSLSILMITHSIGLAERYADSYAVLHSGISEEEGPAGIYSHPYTKLLRRCAALEREADGTLAIIRGRMPGPEERIEGCSFRGRCPQAGPGCSGTVPVQGSSSHWWRCIYG